MPNGTAAEPNIPIRNFDTNILQPHNIFLAQLITTRSLEAKRSASTTHHTTKHTRINPRPETNITSRAARYSDAPSLPHLNST
jgi:hypothetical protein